MLEENHSRFPEKDFNGQCIVTGASGFVGKRLVEELLSQNYRVNALVRSGRMEIDHPGLLVLKGDLSNVDVIDSAMQQCDYAFHLAAYANIWSKDKSLSHQTNVQGTYNVMEAALKNGIKKVVFTSTAGTYPHSQNEREIVDESFAKPDRYLTIYEQTKKEAEKVCLEYVQKGLNVTIVNPTRVFGPGTLNKSNYITIVIRNCLKSSWRFVPGDGRQIANYTFIDDVVHGHIKALEKGAAGENYILGGTNLSYLEFFELLSGMCSTRARKVFIPFSVLHLYAKSELLLANLFKKPPAITPAWLKRFRNHRLVSSEKAISQLNYQITPMKEALQSTISWLKSTSR